MTDNTQAPAILFVHGAWHVPDHYADLTTQLASQGFTVVAPRLPSVNGDIPPTASLEDDVALVKAEAKKLVDKGFQVIIVAHSYGGIVITDAVSEDLSFAQREKQNLKGGIVHLVYLCAFIPQMGEYIIKIQQGGKSKMKPALGEQGTLTTLNPYESFYNDISEQAAGPYIAKLIPHPTSCHTTPTSSTAWRHFPVTYVFCEYDQAIHVETQHEMVQKAREAGLTDLKTETLEASHSPFLSMPHQVVDIVKRAWNSVSAKA